MRRYARPSILLGLFCLVCLGSLFGQAVSAGTSGSGRSESGIAASDAQVAATVSSKPHDDSFVIGNDDVLAINVWKEAELSRSIPVRSDGKISLPLAGEIQAAGRTPLQLESDIAGRLQNYITDPEVTVIVEQVKSKTYNVLGEVSKPGSYPLALPVTIMDAIATAGGLRDFAKKKDIYILRQNPNGTQSRITFNYKEFIKGKNPAQNIRLEPRDTLIVP